MVLQNLLLAVAVLSAVSVRGATYYLAADGSDGAAGTATNVAWKTLEKVAGTVVAGDVVYIRGGTYDFAGDYGQHYFGLGVYTGLGVEGTAGSPIILSNYPGETPFFINCNPGGSGVGPITIGNTAWVKIFGLSVSNVRGASFTFSSVTNCELAYCRSYASSPLSGSGALYFGDNCKSNYVHHNTFSDNYYPTTMEVYDLNSIGSTWQYPLTNGCAWNVFVSNTVYHGQHAVWVDAGTRNYYKGNTYRNEQWMDWTSIYGQFGGHRNIGVWGSWNWFDGERIGYAGQPLANDGATGIEVMGGSNVIRRCELFWNENWAVQYYDKDNNHDPNGNYLYHCTLAHNALGQMWQTNYQTSETKDLRGSKAIVRFSGANNCVIKNCLFAYNGGNAELGGANSTNFLWVQNSTGSVWANNWTNNINGDPLFVSDVSSNVFNVTNWAANFALQGTSPCVDAGGFLTTCDEAGSGTSLTVADAGYFFPGIVASGTVFPGDTIQLQGQTAAATITAIVGNTLTLSTSLTWTNGQGVSLAYVGTAPDIGACEYEPPAPPTGLVIENLHVETLTVGQ